MATHDSIVMGGSMGAVVISAMATARSLYTGIIGTRKHKGPVAANQSIDLWRHPSYGVTVQLSLEELWPRKRSVRREA